MIKHTHTIRRQQPTNCLSLFDHFVGLVVKELNTSDFETLTKALNTLNHESLIVKFDCVNALDYMGSYLILYFLIRHMKV